MKTTQLVILAGAVCAALNLTPALAGDTPAARALAAGQKLDSGLGDLPHYRFWADKSGRNVTAQRVVGEKVDSGLGDIVPFSLGKDGLPKGIEVAQRR
jgi:hypothetical protein